MLQKDVEDFLAHYGVKGQKWGVRKDKNLGVPKKTARNARKDAEEFARAKMFYGQGAGTRRKLIKAKVEDLSARDSDYKKAFDHFLSKQDMSTHSDKARSERSRIDRTDRTKKRAGYLARNFTGEMGTQAAFTAVALGGVTFLNSPRGRSMMTNGYRTAAQFVQNQQNRQVVSYLEDFFKNQ